MTEIERLQDAKRRALAIADERAKENVRLRVERDALVKALKTIIDANHEFLNSLPEDWEGDPLQDACFEAAKLLRE
jgi:hypothetical protein